MKKEFTIKVKVWQLVLVVAEVIAMVVGCCICYDIATTAKEFVLSYIVWGLGVLFLVCEMYDYFGFLERNVW